MEKEYTYIPIAPDGNFYIQLYTLTPTGEQQKEDVPFRVSRALLTEKCPPLITDAKDNLKSYYLPALASEASVAMQVVLTKLHDLPGMPCSNGACVQKKKKKCPGNACLKDMDIRVMFWAVRMTNLLSLDLPGFSFEDVEDWCLSVSEKVGGHIQKAKDWYLLGSIAQRMGFEDLAAYVVKELQNNCVAGPGVSPEVAEWADENGDPFGLEKDWPFLDPHLVNLLGPIQRQINQTKRNMTVDAMRTTLYRLHRQKASAAGKPGVPVTGFLNRDTKGCASCPAIHFDKYSEALKEADVQNLGFGKNPDGTVIFLTLETIIKRLTDLRKVWAEDPERRAMIDTTGNGCDVFKHIVELGEKLASMRAPTTDDVEALMST